MQKYANLVELEKCCQPHIFLQNVVLIQPRTSPPKNLPIKKIIFPILLTPNPNCGPQVEPLRALERGQRARPAREVLRGPRELRELHRAAEGRPLAPRRRPR